MLSEEQDERFRWLFLTEYDAVVRTTYLVLHDRARAEEIAQDAFVQLLRHWATVSAYDSPQTWVRRVAIRLACKEADRERRGRLLARQAPAAPTRSEPGAVDPELVSAIRTLSPRQRSAVVLFYFEDRPMDEVAEILGCSTATGWVHLHRARRRLGELLAEEVGADVD